MRDAERMPGAVSGVVVTSFSSGGRECSQTVTYSYPGNGAEPQVAVRKVGDACGGVTPPSTQAIPAAGSVPPRGGWSATPAAPLYRIDYRVR